MCFGDLRHARGSSPSVHWTVNWSRADHLRWAETSVSRWVSSAAALVLRAEGWSRAQRRVMLSASRETCPRVTFSGPAAAPVSVCVRVRVCVCPCVCVRVWVCVLHCSGSPSSFCICTYIYCIFLFLFKSVVSITPLIFWISCRKPRNGNSYLMQSCILFQTRAATHFNI